MCFSVAQICKIDIWVCGFQCMDVEVMGSMGTGKIAGKIVVSSFWMTSLLSTRF